MVVYRAICRPRNVDLEGAELPTEYDEDTVDIDFDDAEENED